MDIIAVNFNNRFISVQRDEVRLVCRQNRSECRKRKRGAEEIVAATMCEVVRLARLAHALLYCRGYRTTCTDRCSIDEDFRPPCNEWRWSRVGKAVIDWMDEWTDGYLPTLLVRHTSPDRAMSFSASNAARLQAQPIFFLIFLLRNHAGGMLPPGGKRPT